MGLDVVTLGMAQADARKKYAARGRNTHRRDLTVKGSRRLFRAVLPATEAPTVTLGAGNTASTIRATFNPNISADPAVGSVTYLGGGAVAHPPGAYPLDAVYAPQSRLPDVNGLRWGSAYVVEFFTDADRIEIMFLAKGGSYRLSVDDGFVTTAATVTPNDNSSRNLLVDWTSVGGAKVRRVRFETSNPFWGLHVGPTYTVWPTKARGPRAIFTGDSYTGGSNMSDGSIVTWYKTAADLLGWDDAWNYGIGSTGYIARIGGQNNNGLDQVPTITPYSPDVVVVGHGHNDTDTTANIATQAGTMIGQLRAALPDTLIIVLGPFYVGGAGQVAGWKAKEDAIFAAVLAAGADYTISQATAATGAPWFTGTGRVGATTGTGNSDRYVGSDNVHPTQAGHDYLGQRVAREIAAALAY